MDRRGFLKTLGLITGGLALGGVKAVKGVAKAVIEEGPKQDFPIPRDFVPIQPMAEPIGRLWYMSPIDAGVELTKTLQEQICEDINRELLEKL